MLPSPWSLKVRLTVGSAAMCLGVLCATYLALSVSTSRMASARAAKRAAELSSCFSAAVAEAMATDDRMQVMLVARAFEKNGVAAVSAADRDGVSLYATQSGRLSSTWKSAADASPGAETGDGGVLRQCRLGETDYLVAFRAVHFGETPVGTVEVCVDQSEIAATFARSTTAVYVVVTVGLLVLVALIFVNLHTLFGTLRRLGTAARRVGAGRLEERVPVQGHDEMAEFCRTFNQMAGDLEQSRQETIRRQLEMINAMITTVEAKDRYTVGHCLRVGGMARRMVDRLPGISDRETFLIETAAILHDVGKIGVPDRVLLKEGALNEEEMDIIKTHTTIGEDILRHLESMRGIAKSVRHHHERWDGGGYPDGLCGEMIPLASRIIAVADAIDAMMTDRPYRRGLTREKAIQALREGSGRQFESRLVDLAIEVLENEDAELPPRIGEECDHDSAGPGAGDPVPELQPA